MLAVFRLILINVSFTIIGEDCCVDAALCVADQLQ